MNTSTVSLIPGPVSVPLTVLNAFSQNYGSADLDMEFLELYNRCEQRLQTILGTRSSIMIQTGEGMLGLWGALKSSLKPGDRVVAICSGVFGYGIADMAEAVGAQVKRFSIGYDETVSDTIELEKLVAEFKPEMITAVHCETPSGTLNPLHEIARIKKQHDVRLFCVDSVASAGGMPVDADKNGIDLCLNGSQKCLSAPPDMTFVAISPAAWEAIEEVKYVGYDAFLPFKEAQKNFYFPNTMSWHGVAALDAAAGLLLEEGLENVYRRHVEAMNYCHKRIREIGLELFPVEAAVKAPSVTAVKLPAPGTFRQLDKACRAKGLAIAGSYGQLSEKVFRIGHMGSQAHISLLQQGLDILATVL